MSKKKNEFNKSSNGVILSFVFEVIIFFAVAISAIIIKVEENQQMFVYLLAGIVMLFMLILMYCSYCGLIKKKEFKNPSSFEAEYERRFFQDAKPEKKKISSAEYLRRLEEEKNKKG